MSRILFHINTLSRGGAERVLTTICDGLSRRGHEVVLATEWVSEDEYSLNPSVRRIDVGISKAEENASRLQKAFLRLKKLRQAIISESPDVVIAFMRKPIYRTILSVIGQRVPVIGAVRINPYIYYAGLLDKLFAPLLNLRLNGCVFQTRPQMEFFSKSLQKRSIIIFNPINDKYVNLPPAEDGQKDNSIAAVGRIADQKNFPLIIKALAAVHEKHPQICLKIYGGNPEGNAMEKINAAIKECNAKDYVFFMGLSDHLETELPKSKIFVLSSDMEGLPNALIEAMVMGMPCISTNCDFGPSELIENGINGLLTPVGDVEAMAGALDKLLSEEETRARLGLEARKLIDKVALEPVLDAWESYIERIIKDAI